MAEMQNVVAGNLADSIAMLEQILEVMPQDADAIKALYNAYNKVGKKEHAFDYLNRLVDVCLGGSDAVQVGFLEKQLVQFEDTHASEVAAQRARLRVLGEKLASEKPRRDAHSVENVGAVVESRETDISEELALAWRLYEESHLSQEEYSSVLHDLTEVSSKTLDVPVSVLHVLNDRGFTQMSRLMNALSNRSGVPIITLTHFELTEDVASVLPIDIAAHDGALPFAFFGNDLLVAVLNPFNNALVDKVESIGGHRCHTYLVNPEDYDLALERLHKLSAKS